MADAVELKGDDALIEEGWERRSILDEPRLSEVVQLYRDMGLEVKVVDLTPEMIEEGCDTCLVGGLENYKVVYTKGKPTETDELF
jgi:hypothetical protein